MENVLYFDFAATTPTDKKVVDAMLPYFTEHFGNPSSSNHIYGWYGKGGINLAYQQITNFFNCDASEVTFTSGATESITTALFGTYKAYASKGNHIITVKTEHKAVLDTCKALEKEGAEVSYLNVDDQGLINLNDLKNKIRSTTIAVCVMWVNNETGVIQPIEEISEIAYAHKIPFICDATQAVGKLNIDFSQLKISLMAVSGHKIYGPKGVGLLLHKRKNPRAVFNPLVFGGGQQNKKRAGTLNVPGIVGIGKALELMSLQKDKDNKAIKSFEKQIVKELKALGYQTTVSENTKNKVPHILNLQTPGIKATDLIKRTKAIAFSLGSACTSEDLSPSHVLMAMGKTDEVAFQSFRLSFGRNTSADQVLELIKVFKSAV